MNCPYCESIVTLESSLKVYSKDYGKLWLCSQYPKCDAYVGCHPHSDKPLGQLADKELRYWKKRTHAIFDPLWKFEKTNKYYKKSYARTARYQWLAKKLNIEMKDCHIGMFDIVLCKKAIEICKSFLTTKEPTE